MINSPLKKSDIARSFSDAAKTYDEAAIIQKEIGIRLIQRLNLLKKKPLSILDVGQGTGFLTRQLQQKFPQSRLVGIDLAEGMTRFAKSKHPWKLWKNKPYYLCADAEVLPFAKHSFDLIFSNFTLQWCFNLQETFMEFKRVLKPNGFLFFSTLGPNTLIELKKSWAKISRYAHVNDFADMHDIGDFLLDARFADPVIDMEMITVNYAKVKDLLLDLKATGARNLNLMRAKGLFPKNSLCGMIEAYEAFKTNQAYPATFEIIYGHAYRSDPHIYGQDEDGVIRIPGDKIPLMQ